MRRLIVLALMFFAASANAAYKGDLRADTAATLKFCLADATDATPETAWDVDQADIRVTKNGGNFAQKNEATNDAAHDEVGCYDVSIDATDTDTEGRLEVCMYEAGIIRACDTYSVVTQQYYDARYVSGDLLTSKDVGLVFEEAITTVVNQTTYDFTSIPTDGLHVGNEVVIEDVSVNDQTFTTWVTTVTASSNRIVVNGTPPFTVVATDVVRIKDATHPQYALQQYDASTGTEVTNAQNDINANLLCYFQLALRSDSAITADQSACLTNINNDEGSGGGDYGNQQSSLEATDLIQLRDSVIDDQGAVSLGCAMAALLSYAAGDWSGTTTVTYQDASGTETRISHNVATANQRDGTITCPTY